MLNIEPYEISFKDTPIMKKLLKENKMQIIIFHSFRVLIILIICYTLFEPTDRDDNHEKSSNISKIFVVFFYNLMHQVAHAYWWSSMYCEQYFALN